MTDPDKPKPSFPFTPKSGVTRKPAVPKKIHKQTETDPDAEKPIPPSDVELDPETDHPAKKKPPALYHPVTGEPILPKSERPSKEQAEPAKKPESSVSSGLYDSPQEKQAPPPTATQTEKTGSIPGLETPCPSSGAQKKPVITHPVALPPPPKGAPRLSPPVSRAAESDKPLPPPEAWGQPSEHDPRPPELPRERTAEEIAAAPLSDFYDGSSYVAKQEIVTTGAVLGGLGAAFTAMIAWTLLELSFFSMIPMVSILGAIAVGYAIGYTSSYIGGRGRKMGLICMGLAFFAMFASRAVTIQVEYAAFQTLLKEAIANNTELKAMYESELTEANAYIAASKTIEGVKGFMYQWDYTYLEPSQISDSAMADFQRTIGADLKAFPGLYPTYEDYAQTMIPTIGAPPPRLPLTDLPRLILVIGPVTLFLAMVVAFWVGGARDGEI